MLHNLIITYYKFGSQVHINFALSHYISHSTTEIATNYHSRVLYFGYVHQFTWNLKKGSLQKE